MVRTLLLCALVSCFAACGRAEGGSDQTPDAAVSEPDASVDANMAPPSCTKEGDACSGGDGCFENVCGGAKVVAVSNQCLVRASGSVWCWGSDEYGLTGEPQTRPAKCSGKPCSPTPVRIEGLTSVIQVTDHAEDACALKRDGSVWCWGRNDLGLLGHDPNLDHTCSGKACNWTPMQVPDVPTAEQVVSFHNTTCALSKGLVYCWGDNTMGQLGRPLTTPSSYKAAKVEGVTAATQISVGKMAVCARRSDATAVCWGWNTYGQLGHVSTNDPTCNASGDKCNGTAGFVVDGTGTALKDVTAITIGDAIACAIRTGGTLWCWGHGGYGQLGDGLIDVTPHPAPVQIKPLTQVAEVGAWHQTCARLTSGQVWCLGLKALGQLGDGELVSSKTCSNVACSTSPVRAGTVVGSQLSVSWDNTTLLGTDGKVYAWGNNDDGQLGHAPGTGGDEACQTSDSCASKPTAIALP